MNKRKNSKKKNNNTKQLKISTPFKAIISVAWPYANGDLHLGHPAGYLLPASILNDFLRLKGSDVIMVSGSDMHGTPIAVKAWKEKMEPSKFAAKQHKKHIKVMKTIGMKYSLYTNTATKNHEQVVQDIFEKLEKAGFIFKKTTKQFWSEKEHKFLLDRYIEGTCPHCNTAGARGDQCDNCSRTLTPDELINPYSIFGDKKIEKKESENYYLDLKQLEKYLKEFYKNLDNKKLWRKHVLSTTKAWLDEGLKPRAITRDMEGYGVKIPNKYKIDKGKVIYVWFEAVAGYLSAAIELSKLKSTSKNNSDSYICNTYKGQSLIWKDYWLDQKTQTYYFIGKDNIPFHTIIWPAMLTGMNKYFDQNKKNDQFPLPFLVPANQYLNLGKNKFSKSKGNIIDTQKFWEKYKDTTARFFLITRMPENKDYAFTWEEFIEANNNELVANLGNFINRTLVFWNKYFANKKTFQINFEKYVKKEIETTMKKVEIELLKCNFTNAWQHISKLSSFSNKYFNDSKIWELVKTDQDLANKKMINLIFLAANLSILTLPFLPKFSNTIRKYLKLSQIHEEVGKDHWQIQIPDYSKIGKIKNLKPIIHKLTKEDIL